MPGVKTTTSVRRGGATSLLAPSGTYFVAGLTERGDTTAAIELRSMNDYARLCGDRVPYGTLYDDLATFFNEGGARAYVARVVGPAAGVGTRSLSDRAGTPTPTLRVDAQNAGIWSSRVTIAILDGPNTGTFELQVFYDGNLVEDYVNLASPADAVAKTRTSRFVTLTDLGSGSVAPANNPAVTTPVALSAGSDDRASVTDAVRVAALNSLLPPGLGTGAVACPGVSTTTAYQGLIAHARANNRVALLASSRGASASALTSLAGQYASTAGNEYAGLFAPWIVVPDGSGGLRAISPEGYVAACRNRAHEEEGPWRVPAGEIARARYVVDVDQAFTAADGDTLDTGRVSAIRRVNDSVRVYGWRSLSINDQDYGLLKNRDLLNYLSIEGQRRLEEYLFDNIDQRGHALANMQAAIIGLMEPIREVGGVYALTDTEGGYVDAGYAVDIGEDVNPTSALALNKTTVQLSARPSPTASQINFAIIQVGFNAPV